MKSNKFLCLLVAVLMLLTVCFPMAVFADDDAELVDEETYADAEAEAVEDELLLDEFLPEDNVPGQEDVLEEQNEDGQLESEEIPEEPQASEEPQEQEISENVPGGQGEENAFEAAYIKIVEQPKDAAGAVGTKVTFYVTAKNVVGYKWQVSTNNGETWIAAGTKYYDGVTTDTITVPVKAARDGYQFRCVLTSGTGKTVNTSAATLTVANGPVITEQPKDASGAAGTNVTFHVAATNAETYQWQVSTNNGTSWINASSKYYKGVTTDTITVPVKDSRDGFLFRCVVTGSNPELFTNSDSAKLTVEKKITVNGVVYEKLTDTTCAVVGYTGTNTTYAVEKTVNGMTVTEIGEEAFMGNTNLQSITLPDTITIIRARAFKGCTSLSKMG